MPAGDELQNAMLDNLLKMAAGHFTIETSTVEKMRTNIEWWFTPAFFLVLELLLFIVIFLAFLIRWYLSASILSDPERALCAPRRFLNKEERKRKKGVTPG